MTRQIPIERLHRLLRTAVEEGIIDEWSVDGRDVIFIYDGKRNPAPAFEAAAVLESIFRHRPVRVSGFEQEDR